MLVREKIDIEKEELLQLEQSIIAIVKEYNRKYRVIEFLDRFNLQWSIRRLLEVAEESSDFDGYECYLEEIEEAKEEIENEKNDLLTEKIELEKLSDELDKRQKLLDLRELELDLIQKRIADFNQEGL